MPTALRPDLNLALHYLDTGSGEPVVFLNGLAGDHLYWMSQVRAFSPRFRCLALDNRDAGQSGYVAAPYTIAELAADVAWLLESLHVPAAHVVGLSLGGMIAQELALRHPDRVRSLILIATQARSDAWFMSTLDAFALIRRQVADTPAFFAALLPWLVSHRFFEVPERPDWLRALLRQNPHPQRIDGFFRQLEAIRGHDTIERLGNVHCPVQVVVGEDDMIAPPRYARQLAEHLPQAKLTILSNVGHAPPIEDGRNFNRLLREFLPDGK
ncbi:MAG: alpha/beta fold hydrolase [Gemmataceae bacterium]|nr:alpha/beta fold hydrolase [Gemmataceae bacterium]